MHGNINVKYAQVVFGNELTDITVEGIAFLKSQRFGRIKFVR